MYYRMFATGAAIEGSSTIAGYSMNNTAMLLDTRDVLAHRTLVDPHVKVEMGKAGSCEFTILPTHTLYDKLKRMVTFITVEEIDSDINHDIVLFKGRIVELETDLYGQKKVTCEGDLAYLGDSYTPPLASKNTVIAVPRYFEEIITQHNGQVEAAKQFTVGDTSAFSGVEDKFSESSYQNSSRALEDLIEYHGGYLRTRHDGSTTYLDYVKDTATPGRAVPRVEFAKNLVDFTEKVSAEDIFTVLIPLGDKTDTGEGTDANSVPLTLTPPKLNVDDVIHGANAISTFGYILRAETFSGVKDAATLRQRAEAYIRANYNALPEEFTVKAIDLRYLDDAQVPFEVGESITIVVPVRGVSKTLKCLSIQYDLFNPDATEIEVGTGKQEIRQRSLTDQQAQTDAKSRSSAKSAKANTATTEYLTWKDVKAAKELNLTAQKINLLSDSAGGEIVVNQNGTLVFNWDDDKGLNKKVISAASVANTAKDTADTAKKNAKTAQDTADANKTEVEHHAMTLYGENTSYGDWVKANASLASGGLMTFFNGKIAALEGYFDSVTANNVTTWGLSAQVSRFASITGHNLTATGITVRTSTDSSGQDVVQLGGALQQTPPVMTVSGSGTVYVKDIKQLDSANNWQSVVTHPEYPLLSVKTIDNKKYLVAGADTKGQDGYSLNVQKVALEDLLDGENLANYAQLNTNVTFGTVTGSSFVLPGTNSQGQPNSYTFTKHYIKMDDVAKIAVGVDLPYYLGEDDLDLSHTHEIAFVEQKDSSNNPTGKYTLTLKKAVKKKAGTEGETATFDIAATKFYKDAIAAAKTNASVASIAYNGSATPGLSVGRTQTGSSAQTIVLNNVPLTLTLYGTEEVNGETVAITQAHTVSGIELPSVSFQNGSGGTPAITYSGGKPTIDVKAVMSGTTIKSAETYTGNAVTLRPSFTAPSASTGNKTFTLEAYNGTTISNDTKITSKDVTLQHEIGQTASDNKKYLRVRTNAKNDSSESYSPVFYTDYQITWNSDSIQNTNGSSSVTAKVSINGVQYDSHTFTGTYATAESDNETVRANGWAAALAELEDNNPPASGTLGFGDSRTVTVYMKSQESDTALTTYLTRTYTAPTKPTINAPTLNTGTINYTTKSVQGGTQFYVQAPIKVTTSVANLGSTGTVDVPIGATVDDATITYDATTGKPTVTANVKVAGVSNAYLATKAFEGAAPTATLSAGTITEKSGKLPILAKMGNAQIGSGNFAITMSGSDIGNFGVANEEQTTTIQAKYGNYVLAEKVVKAKYTGNAAATVSDIVNNGNAYLDGSNLKVPAKAIDSSENTLKTANVQVGAISVVGDGGKITEYGQSKKVSFKISGQEIASGTVTAEYPMGVSSTALSSASIALNSRDELFYITANQTITLDDNTSDTTHPLYFPWYTTLGITPSGGDTSYGTLAVSVKAGSNATPSTEVALSNVYIHPELVSGSQINQFTSTSTYYDKYVLAYARQTSKADSSGTNVQNLAKAQYTISSGATAFVPATVTEKLYALSYGYLGGALYSYKQWQIGTVSVSASGSTNPTDSFTVTANVKELDTTARTTAAASKTLSIAGDDIAMSTATGDTVVQVLDGTTVIAEKTINATYTGAAGGGTIEASFSDPTRTNLDSNGTFYSSTIKAVASSNDTVINESSPAAITATYGVISRTDNRLYGVGLAKFNGVTYAQNGDWIANLSLNREEADQESNYDFYMTSSVKTNARCSAVSVGTTLCTISIPMWLSASNATLSPGETRNISCSLYGSVGGADTLFASKSIRITCSGGGGSGGSDSNDLQIGWDAAVGKVSIPHGLSSNAAEFKIGYPTDVYDTGSNVYYTLSQSGSMAYVKDRADNIVAQLSLTGAGGSSSGSPEDGWNAAVSRVVVPNWAGSGSSFSVSYPTGSYTTVTGQGVGTRNYTITQNGSYVYVTTKNASNIDVNVAVKAVDVSAGWTAAKNVTTYPTNANSGSDTISITAPKAATYMNDSTNFDTIQYKLVQSGNNVYLQNQTTMQNVAGKSITQQGVNAGSVNIGTIAADGQQHTILASSYGYTHMTQLTYTAPSAPTHNISTGSTLGGKGEKTQNYDYTLIGTITPSSSGKKYWHFVISCGGAKKYCCIAANIAQAY